MPSPTSWKPDHSCGSVIWYASAVAARVTTEAVSITHPASQDVVALPSRLVQL